VEEFRRVRRSNLLTLKEFKKNIMILGWTGFEFSFLFKGV